MSEKVYAEKERAILISAVDLMREGRDVSEMKVADIAAAANVGKGTVYEYFSSKEEIISEAISYGTQAWLSCMQAEVNRQATFDDKLDVMLDWLQDSAKERRMLLQIHKGTPQDCGRALFVDIVAHAVQALFMGILDAGEREGKIQITNKEYAIYSIVYLLLGYAVTRFVGSDFQRNAKEKQDMRKMIDTLLASA